MNGGNGQTIFKFDAHQGKDWIYGSRDRDILQLAADVTPDQVSFQRYDNGYYVANLDMVITQGGQEVGRAVLVNEANANIGGGVQVIQFADGTSWDVAQMAARVQGIDVVGTDGNDVLSGGAGADTLEGGLGDDTYQFGLGSGRDTIVETGGSDAVQLGAGIAASDVSFLQVGDDLEVDLAGVADALVVKNWYLDEANHVKQFTFADGSVILDSQVQGLVQAMSVFNAHGASTEAVIGPSQQAQAQQTPMLAAHAA
jgi:Ca2+-binding RTX toxin-like protein